MLRLHVNPFDYTILGIYFALVVTIGVMARRAIATSEDFLLSGRSLPAWVTGLAFISANLGAIEILGMAANGAQYGLPTVHFYWIGAVPAMVFLGIVMMPFYYGSRVRSVPEFLLRRFNPATHLFNALTFALAAVLIAGVNLYALALVINALIGWPIWLSIAVSALFVLAYITLGGLSGAIYNEVLQFFVIIAGLVPLVIIGLHSVGGWSGLQAKIDHTKLGAAAFSTWGGVGIGHWTNPLGDWIGIVFGLGFVLSFGYWTTNFAEVQRALSAKDLSAAQRTPLIGAYPKIFIPALTIIPGLIALAIIPKLGTPKGASYNDAIPLLMGRFLPNGALGIALAGLLAAFMAGMAANVSSFNTVFTYDIWQTYIRKGRPGPVLPECRPGGHRGRHPDRDRHGVHRLRLQQHHELHPVAVLVLQRAAVRHVHPGHVLEAHHAVVRDRRAGRRDDRRRRHALRRLPHRLLLSAPGAVTRPTSRSTRRWSTSTGPAWPSWPTWWSRCSSPW